MADTFTVIDLIPAAVGVAGIAIAIITYQSSTLTRRKETLLPLIDKFDNDKNLKIAKKILDDFGVTQEDDPDKRTWINPMYNFSFSWDNIPGKDEDWLKNFFHTKFGLSWVINESFEKTGDTIRMINGNRSIVIKVNLEEGIATMTLDSHITIKGLFVEKDENGSLTIHPYVYYHKRNLPMILRHHSLMAIYDDGEKIIRESFDSLLNFFVQLEYMYNKLRLIKKEELSYFEYYYDKAASYDAVVQYTRDYEFDLKGILDIRLNGKVNI